MSYCYNRAVGEIVNVLDIILRDKLDDLEEDSDSGSFSSLRTSVSPLKTSETVEINHVRSAFPVADSKVLVFNAKKGYDITKAALRDRKVIQPSPLNGVIVSYQSTQPSVIVKAPPKDHQAMSSSNKNPAKMKVDSSAEKGQLRQDSSNKTSQVTTKQKSKVEANERVSSAEDNSRDSFSSASFSSDSEIEGKVSLDVAVHSGSEKRHTKPSESRKSEQKNQQDSSSELNVILRDARFFIMKSNNEDNIELSKSRSVWSTPPANESRINIAVRETRNVILIFSVKESGKFSGFARLAGESARGGEPVNWVLPPGLTERALGGVFPLDWISMHDVPFTRTQHLFNPWNDGKPVKIGRDGQEIEPHVAAELCRLFASDTNTDWNRVMRRNKEASRRIASKRIGGPLGGPIPSPSGRIGFRDNRGDFHGRQFGQSVPAPRHTRSSFDSVRGDMGMNKRRNVDDDFANGGNKRFRHSHEQNFGDRRMDSIGSTGRFLETRSQYRDYVESPKKKGYSGYGNSHESYHRPPPPPMPYPPPPPFDSLPPPPRYYDVPPIPEYAVGSSQRTRTQQNTTPHYEKSVSDFLRRTEREKKNYSRGQAYDRRQGHRQGHRDGEIRKHDHRRR